MRELADGVWAAGEVAIDESADLEPPVLLGPGVEVGKGARVARSVVAGACHLDPGVAVVRSVLLERAHLGEGASVTESVVGSGATLGSDSTVTDQTIVGPDAIVAPGTTVARGRIVVATGAP